MTFLRKQIVYLAITAIIVFNFSSFTYFLTFAHSNKQNWYDLIIYMFSDYLVLAFFLFAVFFMLTYNIGSRKNFYLYLLLKFNKRKKWYNSNVLQLLILAIMYTGFIVIICFLEGVGTLDFNNKWSQYSMSLTANKQLIYMYDPKVFRYIVNTISPLLFICINIFYVICYFFVIGMIYYIFSMLFNDSCIIISLTNCTELVYEKNSYIFCFPILFFFCICSGETRC